ncbi:ATP-binding protein [Bradyrhizobium sp.]|uniref:sensor histidine kinase n=1 Tax=Bradyrhizobium sp. TaxID=376 RepID=UPI001D6B2B3C|nr:ATP-binding protein [Bradyrhizobium sp.]MBI5318511.1 PAS domain-containing sensor histidine kinase [Bradyrhizobium sp.]
MREAAGIALSILMVVGVSCLIYLALLFFRMEHVMLLYLVPVLVAALRWGTLPAVTAAIAGIAAAAFLFYPPIYDLRVSNPDQIVDLVLFVIVAVVTGQLGVIARKAKMRAESENLREALIGSVSHELSSPLASIVGSASVLAQSPAIRQDNQLSGLVAVIRKESERLNGDIQNLLDATKITHEGIRPKWQWVDPEDIVNGAFARKRERAVERHVVFAVADDLPLVYTDPTLVESALGQLIENALKYSPPHTPITISAEQDDGRIAIRIRDEGVGLTRDETDRIFVRFYRSPRHAGNVTGSGLGLWITRSLIAACGGTVEASSAGPQQGTTMTLKLPIKSQPGRDEGEDD